MSARIVRLVWMMALAAGAAASAAWAGDEHSGDFVVGVSGAGQLAVEGDFDEAFLLPPIAFPVSGWALDDPGFMSLDADEPDEDFFVLGAGANVVFEIVALDPAMKVWRPAFLGVLDEAGEQWMLGESFDLHPWWHIDSEDGGFNPLQTEWSVSFRMIDTGTTGYEASEVYTARFTNVPEPGALALVAMGTVALVRRRR